MSTCEAGDLKDSIENAKACKDLADGWWRQSQTTATNGCAEEKRLYRTITDIDKRKRRIICHRQQNPPRHQLAQRIWLTGLFTFIQPNDRPSSRLIFPKSSK